MLISFVVTSKLIYVFVFAYAKSRFSHDKDHLLVHVIYCEKAGFYACMQKSALLFHTDYSVFGDLIVHAEYQSFLDIQVLANSTDPAQTAPLANQDLHYLLFHWQISLEKHLFV